MARAAETLSIRRSLPSVVWRATESDGKLVSAITSVSPWPMDRRAYRTSALSAGSRFLSMRLLPIAKPSGFDHTLVIAPSGGSHTGNLIKKIICVDKSALLTYRKLCTAATTKLKQEETFTC